MHGGLAIRYTFPCNVITFVAHGSPVRKFADVREGVEHRHKLPKLEEKSNKLIFGVRDYYRHGITNHASWKPKLMDRGDLCTK